MADSLSQTSKLHFVLFPLMAQGHMIPMVDIAKLLAQRGAVITIVTTPRNASRFQTIIARANEMGLRIRLLHLHFPSEHSGLPDGCENLDLLPSLGMAADFFAAADLLQKPVDELFEELDPKPSCIISDSCLPYTITIARKFKIPRISFQGVGCFVTLVTKILSLFIPSKRVSSETEYFLVPDLPDPIEITIAQMVNVEKLKMVNIAEKISDAEGSTYGVIFNSFEELEPEYVKELKKKIGKKVWCIGPVSLCNDTAIDKVKRGNEAAIDDHKLQDWVNSFEPSSVIYACLGSICNLRTPQLIELGLGLESSNRPFIWVIRKSESQQELEKWALESGFEERIRGRGILIWGWAPQVFILSHSSIGGFITHCGWNSSLEGISSGVPMATWPLFGDQFINEKLLVKVLRVAVSVGAEVPVNWGDEEKTVIQVKREDVKGAIDKLMDEGDEGKERRARVAELAKLAKRAVGGGSSELNIKLLMEDVEKHVNGFDQIQNDSDKNINSGENETEKHHL